MVLMVRPASFEGTNKPIKRDRKKGKETLKAGAITGRSPVSTLRPRPEPSAATVPTEARTGGADRRSVQTLAVSRQKIKFDGIFCRDSFGSFKAYVHSIFW